MRPTSAPCHAYAALRENEHARRLVDDAEGPVDDVDDVGDPWPWVP
jgi:hypothetical protein